VAPAAVSRLLAAAVAGHATGAAHEGVGGDDSASRIVELRTAHRAPQQTCERFVGTVRRECLDHVLVLGEARLRHVLREYVAYFNTARPHQGLHQRLPDAGTAQRAV
jgi:hypothetical protein